ncbi:hypothetical protein PFISCL1PPCAC_1213, partial [Pristionchus fissidentatus]
AMAPTSTYTMVEDKWVVNDALLTGVASLVFIAIGFGAAKNTCLLITLMVLLVIDIPCKFYIAYNFQRIGEVVPEYEVVWSSIVVTAMLAIAGDCVILFSAGKALGQIRRNVNRPDVDIHRGQINVNASANAGVPYPYPGYPVAQGAYPTHNFVQSYPDFQCGNTPYGSCTVYPGTQAAHHVSNAPPAYPGGQSAPYGAVPAYFGPESVPAGTVSIHTPVTDSNVQFKQ